MTSPARRTTTLSPTRTSFRRNSSSLCRGAFVTLPPPTTPALGPRARAAPCVQRPGPAGLYVDADQLGRRLLRRVLVRQREARCARDEAQLALPIEAIDLVHDAVDLVRQVLALRAEPLIKLE